MEIQPVFQCSPAHPDLTGWLRLVKAFYRCRRVTCKVIYDMLGNQWWSELACFLSLLKKTNLHTPAWQLMNFVWSVLPSICGADVEIRNLRKRHFGCYNSPNQQVAVRRLKQGGGQWEKKAQARGRGERRSGCWSSGALSRFFSSRVRGLSRDRFQVNLGGNRPAFLHTKRLSITSFGIQTLT